MVTTKVAVGGGPNHVAVTPNGAHAYVTDSHSSSVSVINTSSNTVSATVNLGGEPAGLAVTPDGAYVYVTDGAGSVSVINTTTDTVTTSISVGFYPLGVAVTPDGEYAYVANYVDGTVSVISTATNTVTTTISLPFDSYPIGVALTPNGEYAYVTNQEHNTTFVISTATDTVTTTVNGLSNPYGVAVAPNGAYAYVTNDGTDSISTINTATNTVTGSVAVGSDPGGVAVTPNGAYVYVTNEGSNTVSVINTSALTASVSPSLSIMDVGQSTLFTATAFGGSCSYTGYKWYVDGSAQGGATASTFTFVPASAGSYSITATVTDSSGATSTKSNAATATVNVRPTVSIAPVGPLSLPVGQVQLFTATVSGGSGTINYQWYVDGSAVGTNSASYSYINAVGSHTVACTVTDSALIPVTSPASNAVSTTARAVSGAPVVDNSWMEKAPMPSDGSGDEAAAMNGIIYFFGSTDYAYNPSTDTWTTIAPMLTTRVTFAVAACGNKIYVIGGYDEYSGLPYSVNEAYDPSTNTWATEASMPTNRSEIQANTVNGEIYVMGGRTANSYSTNITEIYDPATNSWSTGPPMPYPVANAASAVVNNSIYVIGGEDDESPPAGSQNVGGVNSVNFNQIYNPATDSWVLGAPIPTSTICEGAGATTGVMAPKQIYIFGNIVGYLISSNQNYAYNLATNSWTSEAPMPYACASPAVAVVNDLLYVIDGDQNLEQYTPIGWTPDQSYLLETTPPKISVLSPLNQTYKESSVFLVFSVDRAVNWTGYSLDGQQNITITGNTTITKVTDGLHNITVYANDTFGNVGASQIVTFTVDLVTFPTATVAAVSGASAVVVVGAGLLVYFKKRKPATDRTIEEVKTT